MTSIDLYSKPEVDCHPAHGGAGIVWLVGELGFSPGL